MPIQIDKDAFPNRANTQQENASQAISSIAVGRKYTTLHIYASILQVIGWIAVGVGVFIVAIIVFSRVDESTVRTGLMSGIVTTIAGLVSIAMGQLICVWRDTEENTRRIADLLENKK